MPVSVSVPFVDLRAQYAQIREEIDDQVREVLDGAAFVHGPQVESFEEAFAAFVGVRHAIGVANGTDALLLALKALGVGPGDEVITAANTFIATAEAIIHAGARPVFVDIDPRTYTLEVAHVERVITPSTKAVIPVHLYGQPADLAPILAVTGPRGIAVIEDAAQAHGAVYRKRRVGSWGQAACFSFYPGKNLGAYGDAGAIVTDDEGIAVAVQRLRDHGSVEKYRHDRLGYNSRLDTLQAAVLRVKLPYLEEWNRRRQERAGWYDALFRGVPDIITPAVADWGSHVYHLYVIRLEQGSRDGLRVYLARNGIQTGIHYPTPLPDVDVLAPYVQNRGEFPVATACARTILSLPMYPELARAQVEYVVEQVAAYLAARE